jgi:hypothetical protein
MKLSKAQQALLADIPCAVSQSYAPARKLVALGLARWVHASYGGTRLEPTAKAIEAQRAETAQTGSVADESAAPKGFARKDIP